MSAATYTVPDQTGRTIMVTGANSGIGWETSARLAGAGARVLMTARDDVKGSDAVARVRERHPDADVELVVLDLASLDSVRGLADRLGRDLDRLDGLVNNAGLMTPPKRLETSDGFELQLGTNFLGPFALTNLLLPLLLAAERPRVATVSSLAAVFGRIRFDDLQWTRRRYRATSAYGQSKLADVHLFRHLARVAAQRRWPLISTGAHPGYTRTNLQNAGAGLAPGETLISLMVRTGLAPEQMPEQGAEPTLVAIAEPGLPGGSYFGPTQRGGAVGPPGPAGLTRRMRDAQTAARLWAVSEELTGTALPAR